MTAQKIIFNTKYLVLGDNYYLEGIDNKGKTIYQFALTDNLQGLKELRTKMISENPELTFLIKQIL